MLTGGVILAADPVNDQIPEGFVISPEPGDQQSVTTITFCIKAAPDFSNLMTNSLEGNYITVTSPSGKSKQISLYTKNDDESSEGNFYAEPAFTEIGEWTVTTHFPSIQYMDDNLSYQNLPEACQEFSFSYNVAESLADLDDKYTPVPDLAVWSGQAPGLYEAAALTGTATLDFSNVYSAIELKNPDAQFVLINDSGVEQGNLTAQWDNDEHTSLTITFTKNDACYRGFGTSFYIILPTEGTATLKDGSTEEIKDMKAGPWIREKGKQTPTWQTTTPSGAIQGTFPVEAKASFRSINGMTLQVDGNNSELSNMTITNPDGETMTMFGTFNGTRTFTYNIPTDAYAGPGMYTLSFDYAPLSGTSNFFDLVFPSQPYTWEFTVIEEGVSPEAPQIKIPDTAYSGDNYFIAEGSQALVDLTVTADNVDIYYRWTPNVETQNLDATSGFVKYEDPVSIASGGHFDYFAKLKDGNAQSATNSIIFQVLKSVEAENITIDPAPGKYEIWTADKITVTTSADNYDFYNASQIELSIINPDGSTQKFMGTRDTDWKIMTFDIGDYIKEQGKYDCTIHFYCYFSDKLTYDSFLMNPISFKYQLDTMTGVSEIGSDNGRAEYYDLNGRKVSGELLPGIYVERKNGKVTKKIIK